MINKYLSKNLEFNKNKTAIIYRNKAYSYFDIYQYVNKLHQFLVKNNITIDSRVIILGQNSIEFVITLFALNQVGAIFVILDAKANQNTKEYIFNDIAADALLVDSEILEKEEHLLRKYFKTIIITEDLFNTLDELNTPSSFHQHNSNDIANIIYTSGSTGKPKGVVCLNKNIEFCLNEINEILEYKANDIILNGLSLSFDYGLYQILLAFNVGATLVLERNFDNLVTFPKLLLEYNISIFPIVPSIINTLLLSKLLERLKLPVLRMITSTGDTFHISTIKKLQALFPKTEIVPMYGITECKRVCIMPKGMLNKKLGSVGKPLNNIKTYLDLDGQLIVSGNNVMAGYWNEHENKTQIGTFYKTIGRERILYTGDYFEEDGDGFLYFLGRKDDLVKINSRRINLKEIEMLLIERIKTIKEFVINYDAGQLYIFLFSEKDNIEKEIISIIDIIGKSKLISP